MSKHLTLLAVLVIEISYCFSEYNIELDYGLDHESPYFVQAGAEPFSYEVIEASYDHGFWLAFGKFRAMEHMGTHIAAPYTHNENGLTVDQIAFDQYFGEAAVIDIRNKVATNSNYELSVQDVEEWVTQYGTFSDRSFVLINTGWENGRYPDQLAYYGDDKDITNFTFPGVHVDAMKAILNYEQTNGIKIVSVGIDTPHLDFGPAKKRPTSRLLASKNKYEIRNLRNLRSLPARGAKIMIAPMKIKNAAGAPTRVFAKLP